MNSIITWHDNSRKFQKDSHAIFGASKYSWIHYSEEKMIEAYNNSKAKKLGTELHELAAMLIKQKVPLPDEQHTLNMYVNDAIYLSLRPEEQLYYSQLFYGTADAIGMVDNVLHIHDLKTGKTIASMHQLEIYAALFFLEYELLPSEVDGIELRIYQNDDMKVSYPANDQIVPIMDKIVTTDKVIRKLEEAKWIT